jgi:hypothetical protein
MKRAAMAADDYDEIKELKGTLDFMYAKRPRKYARDEFVDSNFEEISSLYTSLMEYIKVYSCPLLQLLDFHSFSNVCYLYSKRMK